MENLQKKRRTTGKKALAYRGKSGQSTGNDFLALGLGVVLYLPKWGVRFIVVEFGIFGAPRFSVQRSPNPLKIGIWGPLD